MGVNFKPASSVKWLVNLNLDPGPITAASHSVMACLQAKDSKSLQCGRRIIVERPCDAQRPIPELKLHLRRSLFLKALPIVQVQLPSAVPFRPSATMRSNSCSRSFVIIIPDFVLTGIIFPPQMNRGVCAKGDLTSRYAPLLSMISWLYQP